MLRFAVLLSAIASVMTMVAVYVSDAEAHLISKPKSDTLESRLHSQTLNYKHTRYVCNNGAKSHKRWSCKAKTWLNRERLETRHILFPPPVEVLDKKAAIPYPWGAIANCESHGNWHINTGNGFYGGLQFMTSTWLAYGGGKYAPRADLASAAQQVAIASTMSYSHWPHCGAPYR